MSQGTAGATQRCAIYTRVSTEEQGREGASLPMQLGACRKHAAASGWVIVDELRDVQSGLATDRVAYQRVLDLARARAVDVVLVWCLDRFGRDDAEALSRLKELAGVQVRVVSATEGEQSPFLQKLMFLLANEESRRTSDRVLPNQRRRVEEGLWQSRPPFGYRMAPGRPGVLEVVEPEATVVRELFRRTLDGESTYRLADWLNTQREEGVRAPRNGWFSDVWVKRVIRNPAYVGTIRWNQRRNSKLDGRHAKHASEHVLVPGRHAPIVERGIFDQVQAILAARTGHRGEVPVARLFLLTRLVRCGVCGGMMYGNWNNYTRAKRERVPLVSFTYKCTRRTHASINGRTLDAHIRLALGRLPCGAEAEEARAVLEADAARQPDRLRDLRASRDRQEARRKRLTLLLVDDTITRDDYHAALGEIEGALAVIDHEIAELAPDPSRGDDVGAAIAVLRGLGDAGAAFDAADLEDRAALVAAAIRGVTVQRDKTVAIEWQGWALPLLTGTPGKTV